jgi:hypothetical protein
MPKKFLRFKNQKSKNLLMATACKEPGCRRFSGAPVLLNIYSARKYSRPLFVYESSGTGLFKAAPKASLFDQFH